jgi:hypothetical protein
VQQSKRHRHHPFIILCCVHQSCWREFWYSNIHFYRKFYI